MSPLLFWIFALMMLVFGAAVIINRNPVASALSLVVSFLALAALFVSLDAFFIGIIQVLVYAGAIMVLFLFIIMLLDLRAEELRKINWIASSVAILLIAVTGIAAVLSWRKITTAASAEPAIATDKNCRADLNIAMLLVAAAATFLMLRFTAIFWRLLPKLRFVQFPWRWMAILAVACAFFQACAFRRARRRNSRLRRDRGT